MVGSALLARMRAERDFELIEPVLQHSQAGGAAPEVGRCLRSFADARDLRALAGLEAIVSRQGAITQPT
jgi:aspartate-semialdehyde dehydrogenase